MKVPSLWRRRPPVRQVTLYGKPGCHLCEEAHALLLRLSARYPLVVHDIDIRTDPAIFRTYDVRIPVIVVDGTTTLEAPIAERELIRALR